MLSLRKISVLMLIFSLLGCALLGSPPTPIVTPDATAQNVPLTPTPTRAQAWPTATPTHAPPTATASPTIAVATPSATPLPPTTAAQTIVLEAPLSGAPVGNPLSVRGSVTQMPFEGTLLVRIYDALNKLAAEQPLVVQGDYGTAGTFAAQIPYGGHPGAGKVEVLDLSAKDGTILGRASAFVTLSGFPGGGYVELPEPLAQVTLPLPVYAHVGTAGEDVTLKLTWDNGHAIELVTQLLPGLDGRGLLALSLDDEAHTMTSFPPTQPAWLSVQSAAGQTLALQPLNLLNPHSADVMPTQVYWLLGETLAAQTILIPRTRGIGRATLNTLLWGPPPGNAAGYTSAIPAPAEVLNYARRGPNWGDRVQLNALSIVDGVARADFSAELLSNPGGALRMTLIRQQIEQTLLQFSSVDSVVITVDGQLDKLEP